MAMIGVKALEAATKPRAAEFTIPVAKGLFLRTAPSGVRTWISRYTVDGKQRYATLAKPYGTTEGFMSLAQACAESARIQALARDGIDFRQQAAEDAARSQAAARQVLEQAEREKASLLPFTVMFEAWLSPGGVRRKDGNTELRRSFGKDVIPAIGDKPVKHITWTDLDALLRAIVARGRNRMAVRVYRDLVQLFAWSEKRQPWRALLIEQNPASLLNIGTIVSADYDLNDERERVLAPNEIRELRDIFGREIPKGRAGPRGLQPMTQIALWLCLSTMCRIGELLQARWEHVDLASGVWHIPRENTKETAGRQQDHTVFLSAFALRQFESLRKITNKDSKWCFPSRNTPRGTESNHIDLKTISKQVGDRQTMFKDRTRPLKNRTNDNTLVLSKGKSGEWTPHDLRRTGATMMQRAGVSLDVIDRCQNHVLTGSKVRRAYLQHDYAPEKRAAWELLGAELDTILLCAKKQI